MRPDEVSDAGAQAILEVLERHQVEYVVIGGRAAQSRGADMPTKDLDITPLRSAENLDRLAAALTELEAGYPDVTDPEHGMQPPGGWTRELIDQEGQFALLDTAHGPLDLAFSPSGTNGFDDLVQRATPTRVAGTHITVLVAASEDILRSKRAANRPKDRAVLPRLEQQIGSNADRLR